MAFPANPNPGDTYTDTYGTIWVYAGAANGWYRQTVTTPNDTSYTTTISGPAGSNTQVQFNDNGELAGDSGLTYNKTTDALSGGAFIPTGNTAPSNGIYLPSANTVALSTNGTGRLFVDSSGRLLVGTSSASGDNLLQVNSDVLIYGITVGRGAGADSSNTAVGADALLNNTTGYNNTANGNRALYTNTTGTSNTAIGQNTLLNSTTGTQNVAIGNAALQANSIGSYNIAIGVAALLANSTGDQNVGIGLNALLFNTNGSTNTAIGNNTLFNNNGGSYNTANGYNALYNNSSGAGNVCLGSLNSSGTYAPVFDCTTENDRVVMSSTSVTNAYIQVAWTVVSDARDKMNFNVVPHGLDFVKQLNPVAFQFKESRDSTNPRGPVRYGFKAQDILALEGEDNAVIIDNEDPDKLRYNGEALVPVLVNAIKEQQAIIDALTARLDAAGI